MAIKGKVPLIRTDSPKLGFSTRLVNIFESNGVRTLKQLLRWRYSDLRLLRGFGETARLEVRETLAKFGLKLKDDPKSYQLANPCPLCGHKRETQ